jgi:hypothetical protein
LLVAFSFLISAATASAECAWVLWEHVTGVIDGNAKDFYILRMADDTRDGCYRLADEQVKVEVQDPPETLLGKINTATRRPGWSREEPAPWTYVDRAPSGQQGFERHEFGCWPTGTDPRPRPKE